MDRRRFLAGSAALPGLTAVHAQDNPRPPRVALVGCGWYGKVDLFRLLQVAPVEVVALCDVDRAMLDDAATQVAQRQASRNRPRTFRDYRELLRERDLDIVLVDTPDHWHALPAIAALGAVSIVLAFWARGGALLTLRRLVVVDAAGERVTRVRAAARALVAWAPVFALMPIAHHTVRALVSRDVDGWLVAAGVLAALMGAAGVMTLMAPGRGIPERVTGTWIVPA